MENMNEERKRPQSSAKPQEAGAVSPQKVPTKTLRPLLIPVVAAVTAVCILIGIISAIAGITASISGGSDVPRVRSAEDAIAVLSDRAEDLGYTNALSELTELHTNTVEGHSYYRLQQNYNGIPVYGRTVVYAADERGELLSVTQNLQDIAEDLSLTPSVSMDQARQGVLAWLSEEYPETTWTECPDFSLDDAALYIYDMDGAVRLVYEVCFRGFCVLIDAHTGEVALGYETTMNAGATFQSTGEKINVGRTEDGTYVLKDEDTNTYVYTADDQEYCTARTDTTPDELHTEKLILVTSEDSVFGAGRDSVSRVSMERARAILARVNHIRHFFDELNEGIVDRLILVYDDKLPLSDGQNAFANYKRTSRELTGEALFDEDFSERNDPFPIISIGTFFSSDPEQYADIIAHEYTHLVTGIIVDWNLDSRFSRSLSEAYSDIFAELYEAYLKKSAPDWIAGDLIDDNGVTIKVIRNLADPRSMNYGANVNDDYWMKNSDNIYTPSTIISHAAYKMWRGYPEIPGSAVSTDDMARLWFTSMLMLPSDAEFSDCRAAVTLAAEHMGLTEAQQRGIAQAFDEAGIYEDFDSEICYLVSKDFTLTVYGDDNHPFGNYRIEVLEDCGSLEMFLGKQFHAVNEEPGQDVFMDLTNKSVYAVTLTNLYDPAQTVNFHIKVQKDGSDQLHLYTNFRESAGEDPVTQPSEEVPAEDVTGPTESQPMESEGALDTSGEVPYSIVRWDRSYRTEDGRSGMNYYFDYVVLESSNPDCQKINETLYQDAERFMSFYAGNSVVTDPIGDPIIGSYTAESEVIYNQNGLLCIKVYTYDAMGGNTDHVDSYSMFFNLNTGEIATLADLTGIDEETLLPQLRSIAITKLKNQYGTMLLDSAENTVSHMQLEEFDYYVYEGEIWLHFEKYSVTPGVCGAVNISTGLYLGGNGEQPPAD